MNKCINCKLKKENDKLKKVININLVFLKMCEVFNEHIEFYTKIKNIVNEKIRSIN